MGRVCYGPSLSWAEFVMGRVVQLPYYRTIYAMFRGMGMLADLYSNRMPKPVKQFFSCRTLYIDIVYLL